MHHPPPHPINDLPRSEPDPRFRGPGSVLLASGLLASVLTGCGASGGGEAVPVVPAVTVRQVSEDVVPTTASGSQLADPDGLVTVDAVLGESTPATSSTSDDGLITNTHGFTPPTPTTPAPTGPG